MPYHRHLTRGHSSSGGRIICKCLTIQFVTGPGRALAIPVVPADKLAIRREINVLHWLVTSCDAAADERLAIRGRVSPERAHVDPDKELLVCGFRMPHILRNDDLPLSSSPNGWARLA